jgi:hypothetical protein
VFGGLLLGANDVQLRMLLCQPASRIKSNHVDGYRRSFVPGWEQLQTLQSLVHRQGFEGTFLS